MSELVKRLPKSGVQLGSFGLLTVGGWGILSTWVTDNQIFQLLIPPCVALIVVDLASKHVQERRQAKRDRQDEEAREAKRRQEAEVRQQLLNNLWKVDPLALRMLRDCFNQRQRYLGYTQGQECETALVVAGLANWIGGTRVLIHEDVWEKIHADPSCLLSPTEREAALKQREPDEKE